MSLLFRRAEERSISYQDVWGSGGTPDLRGDSIAAALGLAPVYAATALISDQIAATPVSVFDKTAGVPTRVASQPDLVSNPGVNDLDVFSWKHQACASLLLRGNAYGYVADWDSRGVPSRVQWLRPDSVLVDETDVVPQFFFDGRLIPRDRLIHIPAYVVPGSVVGLSPIGLFKLQIETGMEAQAFGRKFFKRGTVPSGFLKNTAKTLSAEQASETKRRFSAAVSSSEPFVSGMDWSYEAIGVPQGEVQFLAGIKATANQIAAVYRVAPEDVGGEANGSSLTYKNLEQDQIRFAVRTLRPWTTRFEAVFDRYLPANQYMKHNLDASARADLKTRYEAHQIAITAGFRTVDEVRALEELPPLTAAQKPKQTGDNNA